MSNLAYGTFTITNLSTVTSVDVYYYNSTSSTSLSGGSWSTNTPTWTNGKYIWSKTVTTWEQGVTTESKPVCITGQKGSTGATGQSVTKITQQYALGTNSTTAPTTGWSTTMPAFESGKFYWTRSEIVWANPTSTTYTTAVLANGITSANTTAATANSNASAAVTTANSANTKADNAISTANTANETAQNAVSVANGKNTIYYSSSKPTGGTYRAGDTWFYLTDDGYRIYEYDTTSSDWVQKPMDGKSITAGTITAAQIQAGAITTNKLATDAIKSTNYQAGTAPYSGAGTFLDLSNGNIYSPNFGINNTNDNITDGAYIKGSIYAYNGTIGQSNTNYWYIGNYRGYDQQPSAYIKGNGTATIQLGSSGTWRLNTNRIHTAWNDDSNSGNAYRLHYPVFEDKYWDMGVHVPSSKTDKFLYIRSSDPNNAAISNSNTLENLSNDINDAIGDYWNYQFYVTSEGNLYAKNLYILDDNGGVTQIAGTSAPYLLKSGGDISGNLTIGGTLKISNSILNSSGNAITLQTSLTSTAAATLTGNSTSPISIGITGTLPSTSGGTGNTSYNAGGVVYADNSSPKKLLSTAAGTSGYLLKSGGTGAPTWVNPGTLTVAAATKATQDEDGNVIKTTYLKLTGGNITGPVSFGDSVSIDDLTAGTLIVTGNSSFTNNAQFNTINGVEVGSNPKFTDTTYTFDNGYNASNNKGATVLTVTNAISALNVNPINGATNKTLTSISETAGKISATYSNISITKSQVSDFPTSMPASDVPAWAKASTKPSYHFNEIQPLLTKTYTGIIATANDQDNGALYFMKIQPQDYGKIWSIRYKVTATIEGVSIENGSGYESSQVYLNGMRDTYSSYSAWNDITNTSYRPYYYHCFYRAKKAGITNGYGHALGIHLRYSYNPTTAANSRTVTFEILEVEGCTVTFLDAPLTYPNWPGTGSTNYNTYNNFDATAPGMTESGDRNDPNYYNRTYYSSRTTSAALYRYQFCLTKSDGTLIPVNSVNNSVATNKTLTIDSFDPFGEIFYWNTTSTYAANANIGDSALYRQYLADLRYSFNCGGYDTTPTLIARMPLYLVATPQADGTAKLYIEPLSMYLPSSEDGLIYIYLGRVYPDTKPYRVVLSFNHPIYEYRNGAVRLYTGLKSETAVSDGTNVSLVTTGQKYLWNSKTNNTGTVTSVAASGSGGITISGSPITTSGTLAIGLNLSTAINGLGEGTSAANRNDYAVVQYAGGGTSTTTYHRRKLSNIFKALIADDIPNLAWSKITSGNDDLKAIEALEGTSGLLKKTAANTWSLDTTSYVPTSRTINGYALSGNISISKTDVGLGTVANALQIIDIGSNDAGQLVLTYGDNTTATRAVSITATTSSSVAKAEALNTGGKKVGDSNKPVYFGTDGKPVAINYTIEKSVPADAIFPKFEGTYNESTNKAATVSTVTNAIDALDGNLNNTTPGAGKTLTAFSQTDGKISATFGDISITKSQISDFPSTLTPTAHTHGNISNTGTITSTAVALGNGDNLLFADSSNSGKIERSSITIGTGTSKYLRQDGTWGTPEGTYSLPLAADGTRGGIQVGYSTSGKNYAVQLSGEKAYVNVPWTDTTYSAGTGLDLNDSVFSNTGVTGIKGNKQNDYRTGEVNLTPANLGAVRGNSYFFYGTCASEADEVEKVVECSDFTIDDLKPGAIICVMFSKTNNGAVGSLKLNVNNTGAKPIKYIYNGAYSNIPDKSYIKLNQIYHFTYDGTNWVIQLNYNTNTNTLGYQLRTNSMSLPMTDKVYRYRLLFTSANNTHFVPANVSTSTNTTTARDVTSRKINPFGRICYYSSTSAVNAQARPGATTLYDQVGFSLGYSFNLVGGDLTLTSWEPVYIKCEPQSDGSAIIYSLEPYVQSLPETDDGFIYIFLGVAYSATAVELMMHHPVYWYKNGRVEPYVQNAQTINGHSVNTDVPSNAVFTDTWNILSTSQAGYVSQAPNNTSQFLRGDATWAAVTAANVGLGNVENTKLSTWAGSSNLTTTSVGTLGSAATYTVTNNYLSFLDSDDASYLPTVGAIGQYLNATVSNYDTTLVHINNEETIIGRKTFNDLATTTFKGSTGSEYCNINYDQTLNALVFSFG